MKPKTTSKRPTKPGYYWYKDSLSQGWIIVRMYLYYTKALTSGADFYVEGEDISFEYSRSELKNNDEKWSLNPITSPK